MGKVVPSPTMPWGRESCFSCGQQGHGVTRCSRMDVSFHFLLPGWSVDMRNGRYRVSRIRGDGRNYTPGKVGWSRREGQPPGSSEAVVQLTPGGGRVMGGRPRRVANFNSKEPQGGIYPHIKFERDRLNTFRVRVLTSAAAAMLKP